ncbi:MAG: hypothetical protein LBP75_08775 [Planctomycetota bacterium]|jgi:hypothetical protein|nr:hypothetical protein [Planctomycetota bacterium]
MNSLWQDLLRELAPPPRQPVANDEEDAWEALSAQLRQNTRPAPAPATPPVKPRRAERNAPVKISPPPNAPNDLTDTPPPRAGNRYAALLRGNPQSVRDAVVLAEIFGAPKWR